MQLEQQDFVMYCFILRYGGAFEAAAAVLLAIGPAAVHS
jgi:hypothetical protein